ncbi:Translation initiation factor eIF-2B subunit alpha [Madurella mycetomatis]|uniref:Translation initiation factor eIF2B subunit alpha n=1 Tax=Madurella mycetomatis TaxID=100816 RepID=A0A175WD39_9PEZI|nr:Translation initiation factor eIF-2B subunit alpha [Madurella mycetomatis]
MSTDSSSKPAAESSAAAGMPIRTNSTSSPTPSKQQDGSFDIVQTYRELLNSDRDLTMPVAAIESLIEVLRNTPASTAMETVEIVKKEKAKLLASAPNPLPLLAGADLFEQYLLRSLRGQPAGGGSSDRVLSFDETRQHLLDNRQLFAQRAKAARDNIAIWGSRYVSDRHIVLTAGGSRTVTKILLRAASDPSKHFKVMYVVDGRNARSDRAVAQLRDAGLEVETISPHKVAYVLGNQKAINLVLVGTEVVMQNGGIISGMGTAQLAHLTKTVKGGIKRFYVAAETHKICRKTPVAYPMVNRVGVHQRDISKFDNVGVVDPDQLAGMLAEADEVDYTDPELIDGIITEQGVKMTSQIWEMVDDYI